jgi:hypothetical protein
LEKLKDLKSLKTIVQGTRNLVPKFSLIKCNSNVFK